MLTAPPGAEPRALGRCHVETNRSRPLSAMRRDDWRRCWSALGRLPAGRWGPTPSGPRSWTPRAGGKYLQGTCQPGTSTKAADMCVVAHGGVYLAGEDTCILFEE